MLALVGRVRRRARLQHSADDLEGVVEHGQALLRLRKAVAVGEPLVALPAGADAQLEAPTADRVERGGHLRRERGVAEAVADDDVTEPDALGERRQRGERRERLERDLVGRPRHGVEVIEQPDRFGADAFRLLRDGDGARPGAPGIPAVELAGPALWGDDSELHRSII